MIGISFGPLHALVFTVCEHDSNVALDSYRMVENDIEPPRVTTLARCGEDDPRGDKQF